MNKNVTPIPIVKINRTSVLLYDIEEDAHLISFLLSNDQKMFGDTKLPINESLILQQS